MNHPGYAHNSTVHRPKPDDLQLDVIRYANIKHFSLARIRSSLVKRDRTSTPVFDNPYIETKDLNWIHLTNVRKSLKTFQRNPGGKSSYKPLPIGYSPLDHYYQTSNSDFEFPPITEAEFQSQFEPPNNEIESRPETMRSVFNQFPSRSTPSESTYGNGPSDGHVLTGNGEKMATTFRFNVKVGGQNLLGRVTSAWMTTGWPMLS